MTVSKFKKAMEKIGCRRRSLDHHEWWDSLNYAQKFAASSLYQFGYDIKFVRHLDSGTLVVMCLGKEVVTIDEEGVIDSHPEIRLRM